MSLNKPQNNDEIDLFHFLRPVTNLLKSAWMNLRAYFGLLYARRVIFVCIFALFTAIMYFAKNLIPRSFHVDGIYISQVIPAAYCEKKIQSLNSLLISRKNHELVSKKMNVGKDVAAELQFLNIVKADDNMIIRGNDSASIFVLEARLISNRYIDSIQNGILYYLENDEFSLKRKQTRQVYVNSLHSNLQEKIIALDSVKKIVNGSLAPRSYSGTVILGQAASPVAVYETETGYYREMLALKEEMSFLNNVQTIQPFLQRNDPNYPNLEFYAVYSVAFGLMVALALTPLIGKR